MTKHDRQSWYRTMAYGALLTGIVACGAVWLEFGTPKSPALAAKNGQVEMLLVVVPILILVGIGMLIMATDPQMSEPARPSQPTSVSMPSTESATQPVVVDVSPVVLPPDLEERLFPQVDVFRHRARDHWRTFFLVAMLGFGAAAIAQRIPSQPHEPLPPDSDAKLIFFLVLGGVSACFLGLSLISGPWEWPCPTCQGKCPRISRLSRRGRKLRQCQRCQIDWDTGETLDAEVSPSTGG